MTKRHAQGLPTGWICPVCETVNNPQNKTCVHCAKHNLTQQPPYSNDGKTLLNEDGEK